MLVPSIFVGILGFILFVSAFVPLYYIFTKNLDLFSFVITTICIINMMYVAFLVERFSEYLKFGV